MTLEICVDSPDAALVAANAGADRLEICSFLDCGGLTPSIGVIRAIRKAVRIPIHVLLRPRVGDFCYSQREFMSMLDDIAVFKENGADGVVLGILDSHARIDVPRTTLLVEAARPLSVTFHRAFDLCPDPLQGLEDVIATGADRLLSSGQQSTAELGIPLLKTLVQQAGNRIIIMPGAGIKSTNAERIIRETGVSELHLSASCLIPGRMSYPPGKPHLQGSMPAEDSLRLADEREISLIRSMLK